MDAGYASSFVTISPLHIREPEVAALEAERQLFVIEPKQVENRRVEVVDVDAIFHGVETEFVRLAHDRAALHTAAGKPHDERVDMVDETYACRSGARIVVSDYV